MPQLLNPFAYYGKRVFSCAKILVQEERIYMGMFGLREWAVVL